MWLRLRSLVLGLVLGAVTGLLVGLGAGAGVELSYRPLAVAWCLALGVVVGGTVAIWGQRNEAGDKAWLAPVVTLLATASAWAWYGWALKSLSLSHSVTPLEVGLQLPRDVAVFAALGQVAYAARLDSQSNGQEVLWGWVVVWLALSSLAAT